MNAATIPVPSSSARSILVVDDNVWMQRIIGKILTSYGVTPLLAANGYDAISLAVEYRPCAVILDIIMPDLSGHQTLKLLKTIHSTRDIPVLMITVASDAENLGMAIRSGAAGFIRKPFTRSTIYDKLVSVLGNGILIDRELQSIQQATDSEMQALIDAQEQPAAKDHDLYRVITASQQAPLPPNAATKRITDAYERPNIPTMPSRDAIPPRTRG
ncbi:MAG: response regulator [Candidatus Kapabacteria bacterium]|nr:response regulator [Candidatus Kapabacteria bacterium]